MLWLALHLPLLSLEAFAATLPAAARGRPQALIAEHRVVAVDATAAACGVRPGMRRATALALAADLQPAAADPARDAAALRAVAHAALAFTPCVALHDAQTVLLEVQASLRLFGGAAALRARLLAALAPLGHRVQLAAAPTALGAALLARWHPAGHDLAGGAHATQPAALQRLLDQAPVWLLGPGREHWEALQGMGLHTLADLRALPRGGLARRFGEGLLDELDRALGRRPDPRSGVEVPACFDERLELPMRADSAEQVLHGAAVLLVRLVAWAQARQGCIAAFTLRMRHEPRHRAAEGEAAQATELVVALAEPSRDAAHLQALLRERLARVALAAPTLELALHCRHWVPAAPPSGELFPQRAARGEGLTRLLERLRARLGDAQVLALRAVPDHRPERASVAEPVQALPAPAAAASPAALFERVLPLHRPCWLLPTPKPLAGGDARPWLDGRPLQLLSGPERIETGWWDDEPVARDYYIAQAADGALVWVWRNRLPQPDGTHGWFLHGRFG